MEFTKEEISLCKQVACRHRKEIVRGDYYVHVGDKRNEAILSLGCEPLTFRNLIPLWTISDCLGFLDKTKDITLRMCSHPDFSQTTVEFNDTEYYGKTPLEACLKAVLAILKEE